MPDAASFSREGGFLNWRYNCTVSPAGVAENNLSSPLRAGCTDTVLFRKDTGCCAVASIVLPSRLAVRRNNPGFVYIFMAIDRS
jgi:hypothetical protein